VSRVWCWGAGHVCDSVTACKALHGSESSSRG
jgi:hypothetical protein